MNKRRVFMAQLGIAVCFIVFAAKLFWVQIMQTIIILPKQRDVIAASVRQRGQSVVLDDGRGHFYDAKGRPMTGYTYDALAVFPVKSDRLRSSPELSELKRLLQVTDQEWHAWYDQLKLPGYWPGEGNRPRPIPREVAVAVNRLRLPGIVAVPYTVRYMPHAPAMRLIGFIGQNPERLKTLYTSDTKEGKLPLSSTLGVSGLEKTFDRYLRRGPAATLTHYKDGDDRPIAGLDMRIRHASNPFYPLKIETTIDLDIQTELESLLRRYHTSQATAVAVVLDAHTGDIVAMADSAQTHPDNIAAKDLRWINPALQAVAPGSVFKTVIAAAALEFGKAEANETFYCNGTYERYGLACWKKEGHGHLTLEEAYAQSCNVAFARLSERLSGGEIADMAARLGLTDPVGWHERMAKGGELRQLDGEEAGVVFAAGTPSEDGGVRAQTAIGQRDVRITPLAAANMIVTLLGDGTIRHPRAVTAVTYRNGLPVRTFELQRERARIRRQTARTLRKWMESVVDSGTGRSLSVRGLAAAGKSGTAQTVRKTGEGENEWFVGYGPSGHPRYAVAVLIEKRRPDAAHHAVDLFGDLMEMLINSDS